MMTLRFLLPALLLGLATLARAEAPLADSTRHVLRLYDICIYTVGDPVAIDKLLTERGLPRLSAEQASGFLGGASGNAWPADMSFGRFVFSSRQDGLCAVHARRADIKELRRSFTALLEKMQRTAGGTLVKELEETLPNGRQIVSYNFGPPTPEDFYLNLSLSTLDSEKTDLQALLTYRVVRTAAPASAPHPEKK